ncbi:MAG: arginine N-succinyltransferase [Thermodesulfobacteriota bacterium]
MVIIRPVAESDLDDLAQLAEGASFGLTSLPKDRELLAERIAQSCRDFVRSPRKPRGELYLFVMEDLETRRVVGTSCIVSKVGGFEPFYAYRVQTCVHESTHLGIRKEIPILHLVTEHSGPCEIGGLYLSTSYRKHGNGRLLSLFRFLFMAEYPERFEPTVIAEMRGVVDERGHSAFWEALGRHFFEMDFPRADYLSLSDKRFIADLMPTCPIYIPLLPKEAQEVVGKVHRNTEPALKMLLDEGFRFSGMVDIFEAGPIIMADLHDIRTVRDNRQTAVARIATELSEAPLGLVAVFGESFRTCTGRAAVDSDGRAIVEKATADALGVHEGDRIRFGALRA